MLCILNTPSFKKKDTHTLISHYFPISHPYFFQYLTLLSQALFIIQLIPFFQLLFSNCLVMLLVNASVQETLWMDAPFSAFLPSPAEEFSCCFALVDRGLYKNNFTALSFKLQIHKGVAI